MPSLFRNTLNLTQSPSEGGVGSHSSSQASMVEALGMPSLFRNTLNLTQSPSETVCARSLFTYTSLPKYSLVSGHSMKPKPFSGSLPGLKVPFRAQSSSDPSRSSGDEAWGWPFADQWTKKTTVSPGPAFPRDNTSSNAYTSCPHWLWIS